MGRAFQEDGTMCAKAWRLESMLDISFCDECGVNRAKRVEWLIWAHLKYL